MFIIPIKPDQPIRHTSWVVYFLILINFLFFVATWFASSDMSTAKRFGFIPAEHHFATVFTSMFLHVSLLHILGNMFFLWMFGESVEDAVGHVLTLVAYLVCGIFATAVAYLLDSRGLSPYLGASGAIAGLVGMYMVLFPRARMDLVFYFWSLRLGTVRTHSVGAIGAWLAEEIVLTIFAKTTGFNLGIAFSAHVGGLLAGIGLALALKASGVSGRYRQMLARKARKSLICPSCRKRGPRPPTGAYTCRTCGAKFRIDEQGHVGLVETSKTGGPKWIVVALLVLTLGWVAKMFYNYFHS